ncbi:hypothetical protein [Rickettsia endosymbiont of Ceutorhynchus obstrictus]|uniref:hypothetical protein n=1 Tax=Rickettsia endosymbiont of Ceutorhynchus obstrictus TaxID=3066249 RepID=UPI003132F906
MYFVVLLGLLYGLNFCKTFGVIPWLDPLLYERLNKEVKIPSFRGYDHGIQLIIS